MKTFLVLCIAIFFSAFATAASKEDDVNRYVQIFDGDSSLHTAAVESLAWTGISDVRVFDPLERRILNEAQQAASDGRKKDQIAYYLRALGFSGQPKYASTLAKFASDGPYERYAKTALLNLALYQNWNPVISNRASFDPKYSDDVNRILNMLRSTDFQLKMIGAKRVFYSNKDEVLLEMLAEQIRTTYTMNDPAINDPIAWLVKALGSAKQPKYQSLLQEVALHGNPNAAKYASKALQALASS